MSSWSGLVRATAPVLDPAAVAAETLVATIAAETVEAVFGCVLFEEDDAIELDDESLLFVHVSNQFRLVSFVERILNILLRISIIIFVIIKFAI